MLPRFHAGDLVILRKQATYHVGQVAAYHNAQLKEVVLHRIVSVDGTRYIFKGDNNEFTDSFEPTGSEIIGSQWAHLPRAGRLFEGLRDPFVAAIALAFLWLLAFSPRRRSRHYRRRHRHAP
jgi:signal peptidase I